MPHFHDSLKYLVKRDGISQKQRTPAALDPTSVKLDERNLEDFLVFAMEYAKKVKFYNLKNSPEGNWEGFWNGDPSMIIAAITKTNPLPAKLSFEKIATNTPTVQGVEKSIDNILEVARKIEYWFKGIRRGTSLHTEIRRLIMANFQGLLSDLATLEKSADTYIEGYKGYDEKKYKGFSLEWEVDLAKNPPNANLNLLIPEPEIGKENDFKCSNNLTEAQKLSAAYAILKKHFTTIYNVYFQIVQLSPNHLEQSLSRANHPPHITLFISFLRLFLKVQEHLNQMTKRHLDFFYRDVLGLKPKDAVPDKAHLFFELAKNKLEHSLEEGVRFRADKDVLGNDLLYILTKTTVFNIAKVENLRTLYLEQSEINNELKTIGLKAAPVANSEDGLGTPIQDTERPTWFTMGSPKMPVGTIGFAVASPELLLREGNRTITLHVHTNEMVQLAKDTFHVFLSGEGEWIPAHAIDNFNAGKLVTNGFKIQVTLAVDQPPVLPFNSEDFGEELGTDLPVLKVLINPFKPGNQQIYQDLLDLKIESITLEVKVEGLSQVIAFNDEGKLDAGKPFFPFSPLPKTGSSFFIGNDEVFQKNLKELRIHLNWENRPENFSEYYAGYNDVGENFRLSAYAISEKDTMALRFFIDESEKENASVLEADKDEIIFKQSDINKISKLIGSKKAGLYGKTDKVGFIRLDLVDDFGHSQYQQVLTRQMLAVARFPVQINGAWYRNNNGELEKAPTPDGFSRDEVVIPNPPYIPSVKSISLDYQSILSTENPNGNKAIQLLHLHPFANTYQLIEEFQGTPLLPQFKNSKSRVESEKLIPEAGALLIGISDLLPGQSLSILFQLVENTADAELSKPKVRWYYLSSNQWKPFRESQIVADTTDELLTAGIVEMAIPHDINKQNTILPPTLYWVKASVSENPEAISHAVGIHAQAAQVIFEDNANDLSHLQKPLPADTISKLETDDTAIKGISQTYDSFGGRPSESDLSFYTRVSEHLRHKGRAITLFDYERLILEEFPAIYKVRCVNHTDATFHLSPGHVVISVVPDFSKLKAVDRRQPKVSLAQLERIRRFLEKRNCAFVGDHSGDAPGKKLSLHLLNPLYEKIRLNFKVRFIPEITAIEFHIEKLKNAIVRFLSPWAFEDSADITFGGNVYKSVILHFVEKQPYVHYVKEFKMMHDNSDEDTNIITSNSPISILVPETEEKMEITYIVDEECLSDKLKKKSGLGFENLEDTKINH
jgi:hypothetical protein